MKHLFLLLFALATLNMSAQTSETSAKTPAAQQSFKFGYLSYSEALKAMPDYAVAEATLAKLQDKYNSEAKRTEEEFNKKYEEFLEGQRDFPQSILEKRQSELQELMDKNVVFKQESEKLLEEARKDTFAPLHQKLQAILKTIGENEGLAFILNTDDNACPFVNAANGKDVSALAKAMMK